MWKTEPEDGNWKWYRMGTRPEAAADVECLHPTLFRLMCVLRASNEVLDGKSNILNPTWEKQG